MKQPPPLMPCRHTPRRLVVSLAILAFWSASAHGQEPPAKVGIPSPALPPQALGVDAFVRFAVEKNPRLVRATLAIDAAKGRFVQAGLYPNPELAVMADELGDRTGSGGISRPKSRK